MQKNSSHSSILAQAGAALQRGDGQQAESVLAPVLKDNPREPTALYLMAAAQKFQGNQTEACTLYERSLAVDYQQPDTHNSYGNLLKEMGRYDEAVAQYDAAVGQKPEFAQAWVNLALTEQARGQHKRACECLAEAQRVQAPTPGTYTALGISQAALGDDVAAIESYKRALALDAGYMKALHNMGVAYRVLGQFDKALLCFDQVIKLAPKLVEPRYIKANIHYELGQFDEADVGYRTVIGMRPDFVDAHVSLNNLYWEHGRTDVFAKSYEVGLKSAPPTARLCEHHVAALEQAGRLDEARDKIASYIQAFPEHPGLWRRCGRLSEIDGDMPAALTAFRRAVDIAPAEKAGRIDTARSLVLMERYDEALDHLSAAAETNPYDQEILAYQGLCWRLMGDDRHAWLNDYETFIKPMKIETPSGYSTLADYLGDLEKVLKKLHTAKHHPIDQTLRGGSQTHGILLDRPELVIQQLKSCLRDCVSEFIGSLPKDDTHPLLRRNTGKFEFSASWSVWLRQHGFHVNHVHSLGWLSSAFYVTLPDNTGDEDMKREGWIKFGESGLMLGDREEVGKFIKPEPGLLVLFPSYMWHGTVPYSRIDDRITAPFDVVPVGG